MKATNRRKIRAAMIISFVLAFIIPQAGLIMLAQNWNAYEANPMRWHLLFMAVPLLLWGCLWLFMITIICKHQRDT
jgi:archaellum biogenesis protein FlaJ (TadC family)